MFRPVAPAVQDYLLAGLSSLLAVPCSLGYPPGGFTDEQLYLPGDFAAKTVSVLSGGGGRDETGSMKVRVVVTRTGNDWAPVRDRALALAAVVEDFIRGDPTMGGVVVSSWVSGTDGTEARPEERTVQAGLELTVEYQATVSAS